MAQLTAKQFVEKLEKKIRDLDERNVPLEIAVRTVTALQTVRIFQEGKNSAGGNIGTYSTTPRIISPRFAPKKFQADDFQPFNTAQRAKTGKKGYYGKFFSQGYKQFRAEQGRESAFVNLRLTNDLQSDFANVSMAVTANAVPQPSPIKVNTHTYKMTLKRAENIEKKDSLEEKYGPVFNLTRAEVETFKRVQSFELRKILSS